MHVQYIGLYHFIVSLIYTGFTGPASGHVLAVADEEGSLRLLNIRKAASQSLVKGSHVAYAVHCGE